VLRAVMIDGFGWFRPTDYRRAWMLFDEVDYVFPAHLRRDVGIPAFAHADPWWRLQQPELSAEERTQVEAWLARDLGSNDFRAAIRSIPSRDLDYARKLVAVDLQVCDLLGRFDSTDPAPALSILTSKLLIAAGTSNAVPIVGKAYAWSLLAANLSGDQVEWSARSPTNVAAFAAGLSLRMIDDDVLASVEFGQLQAFKQRNASLLERHQHRLLAVANAYDGLPRGSAFDRALQALELEAHAERLELDRVWSDAWKQAGFELVKRGVTAATLGAVPALAMVRDTSWTGLLQAAIGPAVAGIGVVAVGAMDAAREVRRSRSAAMAYLFEAERVLGPGVR
jgi:hypothetical protein